MKLKQSTLFECAFSIVENDQKTDVTVYVIMFVFIDNQEGRWYNLARYLRMHSWSGGPNLWGES